MKDHERVILDKVIVYAEQALKFKFGMSQDEFYKDEKTIAACVLNLSQIGELVGRLDEDFAIVRGKVLLTNGVMVTGQCR